MKLHNELLFIVRKFLDLETFVKFSLCSNEMFGIFESDLQKCKVIKKKLPVQNKLSAFNGAFNIPGGAFGAFFDMMNFNGASTNPDKKKVSRVKNVMSEFESFFHLYCAKSLHKKKFLNEMEFKVDTIEKIFIYCNENVDPEPDQQLDFQMEYNQKFPENLKKLPDLLLYKIWQKKFLYDEVDESSDDGKEDRCLSALTFQTIFVFRDDLIINNTFFLNLFKHRLCHVLIYLYENQKFFNIKMKNWSNLTDLYICLSCESNFMKMFIYFNNHLESKHIEYAIQHSSYDFLISLWKQRTRLMIGTCKLEVILKKFSSQVPGLDSKQKRFLEWCELNN